MNPLKIAGGIKEEGILIGNYYDKYGSGNPIVKWMMKGYESALNRMIYTAKPSTIHEVGCGEGHWTLKWQKQGLDAKGSDFSNTIIELARLNAEKQKLSPEKFSVKNIYDLEFAADAANLIVCCQVLEHLHDPEKALESILNVANPCVIFCVPSEPLWRILNMARGKYWSQLGNTPGHIQHWSKITFRKMISRHFKILKH
jgi:ubiquinone/menaquinone biosynthesis C-methylase UbiE